MKILYISNSRFPTEKAHGIQIMHMCHALAKQGIETELVLSTRRNKQFKEIGPFEYYQLKQNFKIKKIFSFDPYRLIKFPSGVYIKFQASFFIISLFFYLLFKKNKAEYIFYTRDEYLLPLLHLFSKRVVWEAHALPKHFRFYTKVWKKCFRIIVLTNCIKSELIKLGLTYDKILVSPSAVSLEIFDIKIDKTQARAKLDLPQDKILLGYTGALTTKNMNKGISDVLTALRTLLVENDKLLFVAVGGSVTDIDYYRNKARERGLLKNVLFLPRTNQKEIAIYQKAFDVLLMPFPNKEHYACFMSPLKLFEYMAAGRPIIASDLPTIREILNNESAIFFQPDNPEDLAKKIKYLLNHEDLGKKISSRAQQQVKKYTWDTRVKKCLEFINLNNN